jgi:hypothetical protein
MMPQPWGGAGASGETATIGATSGSGDHGLTFSIGLRTLASGIRPLLGIPMRWLRPIAAFLVHPISAAHMLNDSPSARIDLSLLSASVVQLKSIIIPRLVTCTAY